MKQQLPNILTYSRILAIPAIIATFYIKGDLGNWLAAGKMHYVEEMIEGLEAAPQAFIGLLRGENFGKRVIHVGPAKMIEDKESRT